MEFVGEIVQLKTDRTWGQEDFLGGTGHAWRLHHGKKQFELVYIHKYSPSGPMHPGKSSRRGQEKTVVLNPFRLAETSL
jgi:hypothetical protein